MNDKPMEFAIRAKSLPTKAGEPPAAKRILKRKRLTQNAALV